MDVPKAASGGEVQQIFSVSLLPDHRLLLDGVPLSDELLLSKGCAAIDANREPRAVIDADGSVPPHSRVLSTLNILRQADIARVAFGVAARPALQVPTGPGEI